MPERKCSMVQRSSQHVVATPCNMRAARRNMNGCALHSFGRQVGAEKNRVVTIVNEILQKRIKAKARLAHRPRRSPIPLRFPSVPFPASRLCSPLPHRSGCRGASETAPRKLPLGNFRTRAAAAVRVVHRRGVARLHTAPNASRRVSRDRSRKIRAPRRRERSTSTLHGCRTAARAARARTAGCHQAIMEERLLVIESERISTHSAGQTSTRQAPNKDAAALLRAKDETNRRAAAAAAHTRHAHAAAPTRHSG